MANSLSIFNFKTLIMKTKIFLLIIATAFFCSFNSINKPEFLFLNQSQLKPLGIELNKHGVFYKNLNPNWQKENERYSGLGFYCCKDNYLTTVHFRESEVLKPTNRYYKRMISKETTHNDYYPLLIGNSNGDQSLENETLPEDMKFLPIAICMSDAKVKNRIDTLVVWFKPTESLRKALPANIKMEDYLQARPKKDK
jgi:hypothetical protein